jgi:AcrR family transcriptional regulator
MASTEAGVREASEARCMRADARRNRERILECAREAFAEYGPDAQMDDIARRACVGVGTLYRHFETKDALVGELIQAKLSDLAGRTRRALEQEGDPWEIIADLLRAQAEVMAADAAQQRMVFAATDEAIARAEPALAELTAAMEALLERARRTGAIRPDLTVDDIRTLMCGLGSVMAADAAGPMPYDWRRHLELFLEGVRARS